MLAAFDENESSRKRGGYESEFHRDLVTPEKTARMTGRFQQSTERRVARFVHTTIVMCHLNDILCRHLPFKGSRDKTRTLTCLPGAPET